MALSCMKCMIEFNRVMYTVIMCMEGSLHCHVHLQSPPSVMCVWCAILHHRCMGSLHACEELVLAVLCMYVT